ncbi:MAG: cytochrome c [Phycisphaerae bacterium]|nr:cytochrome c [Phycisphaerae bacterium]
MVSNSAKSERMGWLIGVSAAACVATVAVVRGTLPSAAPLDPEAARSLRITVSTGELPAEAVTHGKAVFEGTCVACHGPRGEGMPGLGKNLVKSAFLSRASDEAWVAFLKKGRAAEDPLNTTGIAMLPRGGNAALTDEDLRAAVAFIHALRDPSRVPASARAAFEAAPAAPTLAAGTANPKEDPSLTQDDAEWLAMGGEKFMASCSACHGKDGRGLPKLGKDLIASEFVAKLSDDELIAFVKRGRGPSDPLNTTKVDMPPKGGNPALNDEQLEAIVGYIRYAAEKAGVSGASAAK